MATCSVPSVLTLTDADGHVLDLMADGGGIMVESLDLPLPDVREDVGDRPEAHGQIDTTAYFGARAVTIVGTFVPSSSTTRAGAAAALLHYLDPSARPVLTYAFDDQVPRTLALRSTSLAAPLVSPQIMAFTAQWKAPDALAYAATGGQSLIAPGGTVGSGRVYNLTFDRVYPPQLGPQYVIVTAGGEVPTPPLFRIYGPASSISVQLVDQVTGAPSSINLKSSFILNAGERLDIDCKARTIVRTTDGGATYTNVYGLALDTFALWPMFVPGHPTRVTFLASNVGVTSTALVISWHDAWLL